MVRFTHHDSVSGATGHPPCSSWGFGGFTIHPQHRHLVRRRLPHMNILNRDGNENGNGHGNEWVKSSHPTVFISPSHDTTKTSKTYAEYSATPPPSLPSRHRMTPAPSPSLTEAVLLTPFRSMNDPRPWPLSFPPSLSRFHRGRRNGEHWRALFVLVEEKGKRVEMGTRTWESGRKRCWSCCVKGLDGDVATEDEDRPGRCKVLKPHLVWRGTVSDDGWEGEGSGYIEGIGADRGEG